MDRRSLILGLSALFVSRNLYAFKKDTKKEKKDIYANPNNMPAFIEQKNCLHCGTCFNNCPVKAIKKDIIDDVPQYTVDPKKCIHCGTCIKNCPVKTISWKEKTSNL